MKQYQGGVRLWRIWRHKKGLLYALVRGSHWVKNPDGSTKCDTLPAMGTGSGFYGFYELAELKHQENHYVEMARDGRTDDDNKYGGHGFNYVIGSFIGWGKMVKGTLGCRTEFAKPEYLILPDQNDDYGIELMTVAEEYGMKPIQASQARELKTGLVNWVNQGMK